MEKRILYHIDDSYPWEYESYRGKSMKGSKEKLQLRHELERMSLYDFEKSLDELIEDLAALKERYLTYTDFTFEHNVNYGFYDEQSHEFIIYGYRMETDEEYETRQEKNRIAREKAKKQRAAAKLKKIEEEKVLLEKLKEKYESGS